MWHKTGGTSDADYELAGWDHCRDGARDRRDCRHDGCHKALVLRRHHVSSLLGDVRRGILRARIMNYIA